MMRIRRSDTPIENVDIWIVVVCVVLLLAYVAIRLV